MYQLKEKSALSNSDLIQFRQELSDVTDLLQKSVSRIIELSTALDTLVESSIPEIVPDIVGTYIPPPPEMPSFLQNYAVKAAFEASQVRLPEVKPWDAFPTQEWQTQKPIKPMASGGGAGGSGLNLLIQQEKQARFNQVVTCMLNKYRERGYEKACQRGEHYKFTPLVGQFIHTIVKKFCEENKIPSVLPPKASTPGYKGPTFTTLLKQVHGISVTHVIRKGEKVEAFTYLE
jgi:hypothetical protein